jgi:hypothetical protein
MAASARGSSDRKAEMKINVDKMTTTTFSNFETPAKKKFVALDFIL